MKLLYPACAGLPLPARKFLARLQFAAQQRCSVEYCQQFLYCPSLDQQVIRLNGSNKGPQDVAPQLLCQCVELSVSYFYVRKQ